MSKRPPIIVVQLIHISGPLKGQIQEFSEPKLSIGRYPSCQVQFPADLTSISRRHAEILREGNQFKLVDRSTNGTFVNGKRVKETLLKNGDVLAFSEGGPKLSFLTQMKEAAADTEGAAHPPVEPPLERAELRREARPLDEQKAVQKPPVADAGPLIQSVNATLIIQYGPTIRSYKRLPITLGRNPKCDFAIDHPALLDQHAQFFFDQNQYWIKDLTGQRLVSVNRVPVPSQVALQANDEVFLTPQGPAFRFLGEGRLLELEEPSGNSPADTPIEDQTSQEKNNKKRSSVFKKFFDR